MSQITVNVPESILNKVRELAAKDQVTLDHFVSLALAEKTAVLLTADYLVKLAEQGSVEHFRQALSQVPDVEPDPSDRIEA